MKKIILINIFLCFILSVNGINKIDSLKLIINSTNDENELALIYNQLSRQYRNINIDSAIFYSKTGLDFSKKNNYNNGIAENLSNLGDIYVILDSLDKAEEYYLESVEYFKQTDNYEGYTSSLLVLGNIYLVRNNTPEALFYYQECLTIALKNNLTETQAHVYNNQGVIYFEQEEYDLALKNYLSAHNIFLKLESNYNVAILLNNIAAIYVKNGEDSLAFQKYEEAIKMFQNLESWTDIASCYSELCLLNINNNNFENAEFYLSKGFEMFEKSGLEYLAPKSLVYINLLTNKIKINNHRKEYTEAVENSHKLIQLSEQNNYLLNISESYFLLSQTYDYLNKTDSAYKYFKIYKQFNDSLINDKKIKKITQMQMQFELDKKLRETELEQTIKDAAQQRKEFILFSVIGLMCIVMLIITLLFINQRNKAQKSQLEKVNLNQKLEYKNKELTTNVMYLLQKNDFIISIAKKLERTKTEFKLENKQVIQSIINDLQSNSAIETWDEFEKRFMEVHSDFKDKLSQKFPDLTPNEMKLCAFLRLNMTTKEISAITYQSVSSINMARFRLRKKMDMERDENLIAFLTQL